MGYVSLQMPLFSKGQKWVRKNSPLWKGVTLSWRTVRPVLSGHPCSLLRRRSLGSSRNIPPPRGGGILRDEPKERLRRRLTPLAPSSVSFRLIQVVRSKQVLIRRAIILNCNTVYYKARSVSGQEESNPALWLATLGGKMEPSCPLGTIRRFSHETFPRKS